MEVVTEDLPASVYQLETGDDEDTGDNERNERGASWYQPGQQCSRDSRDEGGGKDRDVITMTPVIHQFTDQDRDEDGDADNKQSKCICTVEIAENYSKKNDRCIGQTVLP